MKKLAERFNQYLHGFKNEKKSTKVVKRIKKQKAGSSRNIQLPESGYQSGFYSDFDDRTFRNELDQSPLKSFTEPKSLEDKI